MGCDRKTARKWCLRGRVLNNQWASLLDTCLAEPGHAGSEKRKQRLLISMLSDLPRCGAPQTYSAMQYLKIMEVALAHPEEYGIPETHWSAALLARVVSSKGIADISARQISRYLKEVDLRPHKSVYWLNPKIEDQEAHDEQVRAVCECYHQAPDLLQQGIRVVSTDEKTGMQALERIAPTIPMAPGRPERIEFEYKRHGTLCLIPSFDVSTGRILHYHLDAQRTEEDFLHHIQNTVNSSKETQWIFILDQLNTHKSESLVRFVAGHIGFTGDLGKKGVRGILENQVTRMAFLSSPEHCIRFVYTPKHCSWLNQVEIWFGILSRKLLRRGNFSSLDDMRQKIYKFISYFNDILAKPFKWTYSGKPLKC